MGAAATTVVVVGGVVVVVDVAVVVVAVVVAGVIVVPGAAAATHQRPLRSTGSEPLPAQQFAVSCGSLARRCSGSPALGHGSPAHGAA